jgi:nucleoside-diphosphate-sugar epimerase
VGSDVLTVAGVAPIRFVVMESTALVLGASGQVGTAVVDAFLRDGWRVRAGARRPHLWPEGVAGVAVDRQDDASLVAAVGDGCDVVVDCVAFDEVHARQIVGLAGLVGSAVVLSSVGVYAHDRGRTLDEATNEEDFPVFGDDPVTERQTTVAPGPSTYSTRKVAMEQVLLEAELPVTVLRPGTHHRAAQRAPARAVVRAARPRPPSRADPGPPGTQPIPRLQHTQPRRAGAARGAQSRQSGA